MKARDLLDFAAGAVSRHRRRSAMSLVGVTIGVASVIVLTAIGEGARLYVTGQFRSLGSNLLVVLPRKSETTGDFPGGSPAPNDLTLEDAREIGRRPPELVSRLVGEDAYFRKRYWQKLPERPAAGANGVHVCGNGTEAAIPRESQEV